MRPNERHKEFNWKSKITFFYEIVRREVVAKPRLEKYVVENKNKVMNLKSFREVNDFVRDFK
jgi:hypothetical protein